VLWVVVTDVRFPLTIENLFDVFRPFTPLRIVTFNKGTFQALVEFGSVSAATNAKLALDGRDVFHGCCTLHITYSAVQAPLQVKSDPTRARDFTVGAQPQRSSAPYDLAGPGGPPPAPPYAPDPYFPPSPSFGGFPAASVPASGGSVLLVRGLPEDKVSPDMLFTLFGVYGDVIRVKIVYNRRSNAMIQFANPAHAQQARANLDQVPFMGRQIAVNFSKNAEVLIPSNPKLSSDLAKDYSSSPLHRYRLPHSKNEQHISPPSNQLFISSLPDSVTVDEVRAFFSQDEHKVSEARIFGDKKKMAVVTYPGIAEAVDALIRFHNAKFGERYVKVSFSQNRSKRRPPQPL